MGDFHVFKIVQMLPNRATHHANHIQVKSQTIFELIQWNRPWAETNHLKFKPEHDMDNFSFGEFWFLYSERSILKKTKINWMERQILILC